jgi:hypothetical protein
MSENGCLVRYSKSRRSMSPMGPEATDLRWSDDGRFTPDSDQTTAPRLASVGGKGANGSGPKWPAR